jgi:predicted RNA-binding Zn-ribbon protein involved in translation (DUF1610 family)
MDPFPDAQAEADFQDWLAAQEREAAALPRCPTCGTEFITRITESGKQPSEGKYWWVCKEQTCGQAWQMLKGQMTRKPESDFVLLCPKCGQEDCGCWD